MEKKPNIIVMGGSFNPPTIAHLKLIQAAMDALKAETGFLVPVSYAYLKRKMVRSGCGQLCIPTETRLKMLRAMIAEDKRIRIDEGEINETFSVTPQIMERIQEAHPQARIWFVSGADKLDLLSSLTQKWAFLPRFGAVVFARGGVVERQIDVDPDLKSLRGAIAVVDPPNGVENVSSTAVRAHLFDPDAVADEVAGELETVATDTGGGYYALDDGATVKRFFRAKNYIRLQPENSSMDPIITTDCSIAGKVVAVFRRL